MVRSLKHSVSWRSIVFGRAQSFLDVFLDVVESEASLLGVLNIDVVRRLRAKPGVADTPMREEKFLVAVRSLGERRHSSSSEIGRLVGLVVASKRRGPPAWGGG